jgi:hypothetical protein
LEESKKLPVELNKQELEVLINAVGSAQPINKDYEIIQFKLYHKLIFRLNDFK